MKLKENIAISESGFLFDPNTGESFSVNASGKEILKLLTEGESIQAIEEKVLASYDIDASSFQRFIDDFSHSLRRFNLIESEENE